MRQQASKGRRSRHDEIAHLRQQRLAGLLVFVNLVVGLLSLGMLRATGWEVGLSDREWIVFAGIVAVSWLNLLIAAGAVGYVWDGILSMTHDGDGAKGRPDERLLERARMFFYYLGVWANMLALAFMIAVTGGMAESPFVALLIAFILTGQQLSRFRTQSGFLFLSGLVVIGLLVLLEGLFTKPPELAPHEMTIAVALLAVVAGGLLNYLEKPHNYLIEKHVKQPSRARIYRDGRGVWRVVLLESIHRQDPVIFASAVGVAVSGEYPPGLKEQFETYIGGMTAAAGWGHLVAAWPPQCSDSFVVDLVVDGDVG